MKHQHRIGQALVFDSNKTFLLNASAEEQRPLLLFAAAGPQRLQSKSQIGRHERERKQKNKNKPQISNLFSFRFSVAHNDSPIGGRRNGATNWTYFFPYSFSSLCSFVRSFVRQAQEWKIQMKPFCCLMHLCPVCSMINGNARLEIFRRWSK